jgi:hypothetical protein
MVKARLVASSFTQAGAKKMVDKMVNAVLSQAQAGSIWQEMLTCHARAMVQMMKAGRNLAVRQMIAVVNHHQRAVPSLVLARTSAGFILTRRVRVDHERMQMMKSGRDLAVRRMVPLSRSY